MIPRDHAEEIKHLTSALTADGWEEIDFGIDHSEFPGVLDGISFRLMTSPGRRILLTANWRATGASTSIMRHNPTDPRTALWHAEAVNLPVSILIAAARAAMSDQPGPGPMARLRAAGWVRQPVIDTGDGIRALGFIAPAGWRWAAAQYIPNRGRLERGPWMISRDDLEPGDGLRAYAHTDAGAPGGVIAALALTDGNPTT